MTKHEQLKESILTRRELATMQREDCTNDTVNRLRYAFPGLTEAALRTMALAHPHVKHTRRYWLRLIRVYNRALKRLERCGEVTGR